MGEQSEIDRLKAENAKLLGEGFEARLQQEWTNFLDANPDGVTSPEEYPDHALVTFDQMLGIVQAALEPGHV